MLSTTSGARCVKQILGRQGKPCRPFSFCLLYFQTCRNLCIIMHTHSVIAPPYSARNTPLYYLSDSNVFSPVSVLLGIGNIHEDLLSPWARTFVRVLFTYNARVGELLAVSNRHIIAGERVVVTGSKGSASFMIHLPGISKLHGIFAPGAKVVPLFPFTYMQVYRWCLRIGAYSALYGRENRAVTHISRYATVDQIASLPEPHELSDILKHRNPDNVNYYTQKGVK